MPFRTIPLPQNAQLPEAIQKSLASLPPLNVFHMLANVPTSFEPFIQLINTLFKEGKFNPRLREIATLRQAHLLRVTYEWHQHVFLAKGNGVTDDEIEIIRNAGPVTDLGEEGNFICKITDEITHDARLSDATFHELFERYSIELGTELILCVSYLNMLGRFINATRVEIEDDDPLDGKTIPTA